MTSYTEGEPTNIIYVPRYIKKDDIESVTPYIGGNGKLFRQLTSIETYTNKNYIIVGNYKKHIESLKSKRAIGYNSNKTTY